jgi:hypothetical protein
VIQSLIKQKIDLENQTTELRNTLDVEFREILEDGMGFYSIENLEANQ